MAVKMMRKSVKGSLKVAIKTARKAETVTTKVLTHERTKHVVRSAKTRIHNSLGTKQSNTRQINCRKTNTTLFQPSMMAAVKKK